MSFRPISATDESFFNGFQLSMLESNYRMNTPKFVGLPGTYAKEGKVVTIPEDSKSVDVNQLAPLLIQFECWKQMEEATSQLKTEKEKLTPEQRLVLEKRMDEFYSTTKKKMHSHPIGLFFRHFFCFFFPQ